MKYDYLIIGSGLFGSTFTYEATKRGKTCLVIEKRPQTGGNLYCQCGDGINIHQYGPHIFHTSNRQIWEYIRNFAEFNHFVNSPVANYKGEIYNLPFNMNTFNRMWGVVTPEQAKQIIEEQKCEINGEPANLEEQAISLIGKDIYLKLIKEYTEKQWGRDCRDLPAFIIKRLPVRYTYDNNYFNDLYQGIPIGGYNGVIDKMLENCKILLNTDFNEDREKYSNMAEKVLYTGQIDSYYDYCCGKLEYRSLRFETQKYDTENYQGVAVMNFTDRETPFTRIIEHKHFEFGTQPVTYVTKEYPLEWKEGHEPYYPVNDEKNRMIFDRYRLLARNTKDVFFGGRLAEYKYYDMDKTIASALDLVKKEFGG
jgi:UDP-galactopyranose mutase